MRVAELDTTSSSHQCPSGLTNRTYGDIRTCVRSLSEAGCTSVMYATANINYSSVCGRIIAYQFGTTDAFQNQENSDINSPYVDGVSLTHGDPRQHIWTFAAALHRNGTSASDCPCQGGQLPPSFVGSDYFCESGSVEPPIIDIFYPNPLWDGTGCSCCNDTPWFYKQLPQPTTDDIEMRVCRDHIASAEDIAIQVVEIYVQ